jgi:hypothetical protein
MFEWKYDVIMRGFLRGKGKGDFAVTFGNIMGWEWGGGNA